MYSNDLPSSEHYLLAAMNLDPSYQGAHSLNHEVKKYAARNLVRAAKLD